MIHYQSRGFALVRKLWSVHGSVYPSAFAVALPCGFIASAIVYCARTPSLAENVVLAQIVEKDGILQESYAWSGFSFLVGFLVVFRTSQSYYRFWEGCQATHRMRAEWLDAYSAIVAFCRHSEGELEDILQFQNLLARLFSMLHSSALAMVADSNDGADMNPFMYPLLDPAGIDPESLIHIKNTSNKAELIFQWIQALIVEQISTGVLSIPAPILSRCFQELANGMVALHDALRISDIPFPFPYAQTCDFLLIIHWLLAPVVTSQWVSKEFWCFVFTFIQVFFLWSLNFIATELEHPFGSDANDIDGFSMQRQLNEVLVMCLQSKTRRLPTLTTQYEALDEFDQLADPLDFCGGQAKLTMNVDSRRKKMLRKTVSFNDVWMDISGGKPSVARRRSQFFHSNSPEASLFNDCVVPEDSPSPAPTSVANTPRASRQVEEQVATGLSDIVLNETALSVPGQRKPAIPALAGIHGMLTDSRASVATAATMLANAHAMDAAERGLEHFLCEVDVANDPKAYAAHQGRLQQYDVLDKKPVPLQLPQEQQQQQQKQQQRQQQQQQQQRHHWERGHAESSSATSTQTLSNGACCKRDLPGRHGIAPKKLSDVAVEVVSPT